MSLLGVSSARYGCALRPRVPCVSSAILWPTPWNLSRGAHTPINLTLSTESLCGTYYFAYESRPIARAGGQLVNHSGYRLMPQNPLQRRTRGDYYQLSVYRSRQLPDGRLVELFNYFNLTFTILCTVNIVNNGKGSPFFPEKQLKTLFLQIINANFHEDTFFDEYLQRRIVMCSNILFQHFCLSKENLLCVFITATILFLDCYSIDSSS